MGWICTIPKGCKETMGKHRTPKLKRQYLKAKKNYTRCVKKHCKPKNFSTKEMVKDKNVKCVLKHCLKEDWDYSKASFF
jgi:hypothetical protein